MVPHRRLVLTLYLHDHLGAAAGVELAERLAQENQSSTWFDPLCRLAADLAEDETILARVRARVGIRYGRTKRTLGRLGASLARARPHPRLQGQAHLRRVLDTEALIAGVSAKKQLWAALGQEGGLYFGDDADFDFTELERRADAQLDCLRAFHRATSAHAFAS